MNIYVPFEIQKLIRFVQPNFNVKDVLYADLYLLLGYNETARKWIFFQLMPFFKASLIDKLIIIKIKKKKTLPHLFKTFIDITSSLRDF